MHIILISSLFRILFCIFIQTDNFILNLVVDIASFLQITTSKLSSKLSFLSSKKNYTEL